MRVEVKDGYCTGNYAYIGCEEWTEAKGLPVNEPLKLKSYMMSEDGTLEFDETRYNELLALEENEVRKKEILAEIEKLKADLAETDYQITKCYEYSLAGKELPYDIDSLHAERQAIRDTINSLEEELSML